MIWDSIILKNIINNALPKQTIKAPQLVPSIDFAIKRPVATLDVGIFAQNMKSNPQLTMLVPTKKAQGGIDDSDKYQATTSRGARGVVTTDDYYIGESAYID